MADGGVARNLRRSSLEQTLFAYRRREEVGELPTVRPLHPFNAGRERGVSPAYAMKRYVVILVPRVGGGWRAFFPDFPGLQLEGSITENAIDAARAAVKAVRSESQGAEGPPPTRTLEEIQSWGAEHSVDWATAVVTLVEL